MTKSSIFTSLTFLAALQESKIFKAHFVAYLVLGGVALANNVCSFSALRALRNRLINDTSQICSNFHLKTPFNDLYDLIINPVINLLADQ